MTLKLAAAWTFVALSVSPCFGQSWEGPDAGSQRFSLSSAVRRVWQTDAKGLIEMVTAEHPQGADRCWNRIRGVEARTECFQRLIGKHFLRKVTSEATQLRSWCLDDTNPRRCFDALGAQEVERWRYTKTSATTGP